MSHLRRLAGAALLLFVLAPLSAGQKDDKSSLTTLTYEQVGKMVRDQKGKVVVVYFWADYCSTCKSKGLPRLVQMHKDYSKDGLIVLSVAVDDLTGKGGDKVRASLTKFLYAKLKAPFETVHLDPKSAKL